MGGGNGLKSHMAKQKGNVKEKVGGGGAAGRASREAPSDASLNCAICRAPFTNAKQKTQLNSHHQAKHGKNSFAECFPGVTP